MGRPLIYFYGDKLPLPDPNLSEIDRRIEHYWETIRYEVESEMTKGFKASPIRDSETGGK